MDGMAVARVGAGAMPSGGRAVSATPSSAISPDGRAPALPASWTAIPLDRLDGDGWRALATPDRANALALAAGDLPPPAPPADPDTVRSCIGGLRLATIPRDESAEEQIGRARMLNSVLKDVPADILKAACAAYVRGNKWFPTPAEMQPYVDASRKAAPLSLNWTRWKRLKWLAEAAAEAEHRAACEANPVNPEQLAALISVFAGKLKG